jgi:hypothetical protein
MSTTTKPTVRELRRSAKSLNVTGWEEMDEAALTKAVGTAQTKSAKTASTRTGNGAKKAAAAKTEKAGKVTKADKEPKKAAAKAEPAELPENGNPFKEGTNMFLITEELIKGGKRSSMVGRLKKKIELEPRSKDKKDFDVDYEMDRRVLITGQLLRNQHGFEVTREGRGTDATIKAVAP